MNQESWQSYDFSYFVKFFENYIWPSASHSVKFQHSYCNPIIKLKNISSIAHVGFTFKKKKKKKKKTRISFH